MVNSLYVNKYSGRTEKEAKSGTPANKQYNYKYEPSMTDQSFNYSIAEKVEDFIAAGQVISAAAEKKHPMEYDVQQKFAMHSIESFYGDDLPVVQEKIRNEANRISEILENENLTEKERKAMEYYLSELEKAGGTGDGV